MRYNATKDFNNDYTGKLISFDKLIKLAQSISGIKEIIITNDQYKMLYNDLCSFQQGFASFLVDVNSIADFYSGLGIKLKYLDESTLLMNTVTVIPEAYLERLDRPILIKTTSGSEEFYE